VGVNVPDDLHAPPAVDSPLPLDFSDLAYQIPDLVAVKFGDRGYSVDVPQEVFGCAQECLEGRLTFGATEHVTIRRDDHLDQPGRGPVFTQQASQDRLEVGADLDGPEFTGAVLANLVRFTDRDVVGHKNHPHKD